MNFAPVTRFASRNALKIKKNSPQILFYAGIVGTVATTVLASRATLKAVPVVERLKETRAELDSFHLEDKVEPEVYNKEVINQYTVAAIDLTKLYGPVVIVGVASIAALTKSHRQLRSRNTALTMAYTGLFKTFETYRERVRAELGDEIDQQWLHGTVKKEIEYEDSKGKLKTKEITVLDPESTASNTYLFDASLGSWCKDVGYNQTYLDSQQDYANLILQKRGHMLLNDIYDSLQIPRTPEGGVLGWKYPAEDGKEDFIDFGHRKDGEFFAGYKRDVLLEFNIHGPILESI